MYRKILSACVGLVLGASAASADVSGRYTVQGDGHTVGMELREDATGNFAGAFTFDSATATVAGRENNNQLQGVINAPTGQQVPFTATLSGPDLMLNMNGGSITLQSSAGGNPPQVNVAPVQQQPAAANVGNIQSVQGQIFAYAVPAGWQANESQNGVDLVSPDGNMAASFMGIEGIQACTSMQFLQNWSTQMLKLQNLQILSAQRIDMQGSDAIEATLSFTGPNGQPCKSWVRVAVTSFGMGSNAYMQMATARADLFDQNLPQIKAVAEHVQITNPSLAFGRAQASAVQVAAGPSLNHPMDDTVTSGYWANQKTMDGVAARRSDVATDTYTMTDPQTGQKYYVDQNAFDPTKGGVVNPNRPTELLQGEPQWEGH